MTPGWHKIVARYYHADPCPTPSLSSGVLRTLLNKSPLHAKTAHPKLNPNYVEYDDDKFDLGSAAHAWALEGEQRFVIVDADDWRTKAAKEARDAAREKGKVPLLRDQAERVEAMIGCLNDNLDKHEIGDIFKAKEGRAEISGLWQEGDFWFRCRPDWMVGRAIYDYKTTADANPESFGRTTFNFGYDIQAAFYLRGARAIDPGDWTFRFIVQESVAPYSVTVCELDAAALDFAEQRVAKGISLWKDCLKNNRWPSYTPRVAMIQAPAWLHYKEAEADQRREFLSDEQINHAIEAQRT